MLGEASFRSAMASFSEKNRNLAFYSDNGFIRPWVPAARREFPHALVVEPLP